MNTRTCAQCGARNAAGAPWCTQCYTPFGSSDQGGDEPAAADGTPDAEPESAPAPAAPGVSPARGGPPGDEPETPQAPPVSATQRDIRQRADGEIEWRCATCEGWNDLGVAACVACGAPRRGFGSEPQEPAEQLDEDRLVAASVLLPGLGHLRAGRTGSGVARAVFAVGWLVGGLLLLLAAARAGGGAYLAAVPLLAGAAAVWVLTVWDIRSLARGEDTERLDGRVLLWLMAGVTGALVLVLILDTWRLAA